MCAKINQEAQNPLILRCYRLMEAFAKSDDERDFYIDRMEGFLVYVDLDKSQPELTALEEECHQNPDRYCAIPKLSFYETKKIMEGFVNEKVYDIDTKEKLLDIIQSKEARENFLEFIHDHHAEQEKWQQFYQERSRIRIIEWLRLNHFHFVFEEDLELPPSLIEKLKHLLFQSKVSKEIQTARKALVMKAKTYYSNEALNPRPKRGRPPKQAAKLDIEPQVTLDIYTTVPPPVLPFLFTPEIHPSPAFSAFSSKFESEEDLLIRRHGAGDHVGLSQKLAALRALSSRWADPGQTSVDASVKPLAREKLRDEEADRAHSTEISSGTSRSGLKNGKPKIANKKRTEKVTPPSSNSPSVKPSVPGKPKAKRIIPRSKEN